MAQSKCRGNGHSDFCGNIFRRSHWRHFATQLYFDIKTVRRKIGGENWQTHILDAKNVGGFSSLCEWLLSVVSAYNSSTGFF
jgi:hypothetical protein